ncbi:hypothetical protein ILUMI_00629 [Ignelater luminosus]|uniref:COX assembly mitochondrial protein n=1 Tax=Ignelater luminosus TaxID=2038154 RepID=A0A8K0DGV2_IGNLU|nr:hypothetical protein ILUMI_00629 [Ignelater luminosus]
MLVENLKMPPLDVDPTIYFLNIEECYELMHELNRCYLENPYLRYFGKCSSANSEVGRCLMRQRELKQQNNLEESRIKYRRLQEKLRKLHNENETT